MENIAFRMHVRDHPACSWKDSVAKLLGCRKGLERCPHEEHAWVTIGCSLSSVCGAEGQLGRGLWFTQGGRHSCCLKLLACALLVSLSRSECWGFFKGHCLKGVPNDHPGHPRALRKLSGAIPVKVYIQQSGWTPWVLSQGPLVGGECAPPLDGAKPEDLADRRREAE